jgi:A/G-specific adenine glycosylase
VNPAAADVALGWYAKNGRDLAFRRTADPWAILVSEVMAQQTQAERAAEAWTRFMARFPTPAALAAAAPADVIREWRGLGYNRRAVALRRAAIAIVDLHGGRVPDTLDALTALPGVGPYTARAVLAIAFGRPVAALDVNIRRVLGRALLPPGIATRDLQPAADALIPPDRAADWTHALMDIGAAFCRPREPRCDACPLSATCEYARSSDGVRAGIRGAAALPARASTQRPTAPSFESTTRWLRGRILDRLRDADGWVTFDGAIGTHDRAAVRESVARLAAEGMIELVDGRARLGIE